MADPYDATTELYGGRLLQRIHLGATHRGLALQHMNQITERIDRERATGAQPTFAARFAGDTMTATTERQRIGTTLAATGAALGVVAGIIQATVGASIPDWTGAKASPGALGALTVVLSLVAASACAMSGRPRFGPGARLVAVVALVLPALVCFATVGRLWIVPGPLLLIGASFCIGSWSEAAVLTRRNWIRVLLACLGGFEMLMATTLFRQSAGPVGTSTVVQHPVTAP